MPRGGCRCRSRLEKSAIAAPILDGITDVHAQGSTIARVHPEIRRISRSHLAVMHALGVSSSLLMCPRDPLSRCRSRSHLTVVRNSRGCSVCTSRRRCHARAPPPRDPPSRPLPPRRRAHLMGPSPRACPRDPMPQPLPPRRRARLRGPSSRASLRDPPPRACPPDPPSRAPLGGGGVTIGAKTES